MIRNVHVSLFQIKNIPKYCQTIGIQVFEILQYACSSNAQFYWLLTGRTFLAIIYEAPFKIGRTYNIHVYFFGFLVRLGKKQGWLHTCTHSKTNVYIYIFLSPDIS